MQRTRLLMVGSVLLIFAFPLLSRAEESDKKRLQGSWVVESAELASKPYDQLKGAVLTFKDSLAVMKSKLSSGREDVDENSFELDESASPKRITLFQKKDREKGVQRGIYSLNKDALIICVSVAEDKEYPGQFSSQPKYLLLTLKRQ